MKSINNDIEYTLNDSLYHRINNKLWSVVYTTSNYELWTKCRSKVYNPIRDKAWSRYGSAVRNQSKWNTKS